VRLAITCFAGIGGSGIVATELGKGLAARGHEVHFVCADLPFRLEDLSDRLFFHPVRPFPYPVLQSPLYDLALASRLSEVIAEQELDLLHVHYAIPHSVSAYLARAMMAPKRKLPFVTTLHGTDITLVGADRSYFPITKFSIEQSDGITAISENLQQDTIRVFGVANEIRVIHNFVNCTLYYPQPEWRSARPTLLHISNFRPVKRIVDCVQILARVRKEVDAQLWMAGDGPDRSAAERAAYDLGVQDHVSFLGKQDHMERLIPQAHVLLLPSEMESFGLAALEAMACGVVPVATRVGGVPELIEAGVNGFLEAVGDIEGQAGRVIELLSRSPLHGRMAATARRTAEARFCTTLVIPRYEQYYSEVMGR
jgi:L-malate glycosyltransferase